MSTADSQILGCSAAFTEDIAGRNSDSIRFRRLATAFVTAIALTISLSALDSVFALVLYAWSVLAAAFAPLIIIYALGERLTETKALVVMVSSTAVALLWREFGLGMAVYEVAPAMVFGLFIYFCVLKPFLSTSDRQVEM